MNLFWILVLVWLVGALVLAFVEGWWARRRGLSPVPLGAPAIWPLLLVAVVVLAPFVLIGWCLERLSALGSKLAEKKNNGSQ